MKTNKTTSKTSKTLIIITIIIILVVSFFYVVKNLRYYNGLNSGIILDFGKYSIGYETKGIKGFYIQGVGCDTNNCSDPVIKYNFDHVFGLHSETRALRVYSNWMTGSGIIYWELNNELSNQYNDVWDYYMVRLINFHVDYEHIIQSTDIRE